MKTEYLMVKSYASAFALMWFCCSRLWGLEAPTGLTTLPLHEGGWLMASDFGARGDGIADDTAALQAAVIAAAKKEPIAGLYLPAGRYRYRGTIAIDNVTVRGAGTTKTVLIAAEFTRSALMLTGAAPAIANLSIQNEQLPDKRYTTPESAGIHVNHARQFRIQDVELDGSASAGILVRQSGEDSAAQSVIDNVVVTGTRADGIHITAGSRNIRVSRSTVRQAGDDSIAVVSYISNRSACSNIHISENLVEGSKAARGIAVVGGEGIEVSRNRINGSVAASILVASESSYNTFASVRVAILENKITNAVTHSAVGHGAIHVVGRRDYLVSAVVIRGNEITGASRMGVYIGANTDDIRVEGNTVEQVNTSGIVVAAGAGNVSLGVSDESSRGNRIQGVGENGITVDPKGGSGRLTIGGNYFRKINQRGTVSADVINIGGRSDFAEIVLVDNRFDWFYGETRPERFIESLSPVALLRGNTTSLPLGVIVPSG